MIYRFQIVNDRIVCTDSDHSYKFELDLPEEGFIQYLCSISKNDECRVISANKFSLEHPMRHIKQNIIAGTKWVSDFSYSVCTIPEYTRYFIREFAEIVYLHKNAGIISVEEYENKSECIHQSFKSLLKENIDDFRYFQLILGATGEVYYLELLGLQCKKIITSNIEFVCSKHHDRYFLCRIKDNVGLIIHWTDLDPEESDLPCSYDSIIKYDAYIRGYFKDQIDKHYQSWDFFSLVINPFGNIRYKKFYEK